MATRRWWKASLPGCGARCPAASRRLSSRMAGWRMSSPLPLTSSMCVPPTCCWKACSAPMNGCVGSLVLLEKMRGEISMTDDDDGQHANGHGRSTGGHWVSEGGRLRWVPARELAGNEPENDEAARELDDMDEAAWASDAPPLPPGAPESARVRAALAWLRRMRDLEREIVGELGFIEREQLRQQ